MTKRLQFLNNDSWLSYLLFGLFSIILLTALYLFNVINFGYKITSSESAVTWLLILFSYPHFLASYYWFYTNENLRSENKTVGLYLPIGLVGLLVIVMTVRAQILLQPMLFAAWILLFWHFVKQSYGCSVYLARHNFDLKSKSWLLYSYLCLAGFGFLNIQRQEAKIIVFKSYISVHKVPEIFSLALLAFAWLLFLLFVFSYFNKAINQPKKETLKKIFVISIPWIANLMWFSWWSIESFFALIPIFHALQYSPFILQGIARLQTDTKSFYKVVLAVLLVSTTVFVLIPMSLNLYAPELATGFVTSIFIFFNLHHFFIDSVGWKLSQESLRKILFS